MKRVIRRYIAVIAAFCIAFTGIPLAAGGLGADAASPYFSNLKCTAKTQTALKLKWKKLSKSQQKKITGIAVFRDGKLVKRLGRTKATFTDKGLQSGKTYKYQLKTYKKKTVTKWYNKKTKKWVTKKPAKKYRGKSKKTVKYVYANKSKTIKATTKPASSSASTDTQQGSTTKPTSGDTTTSPTGDNGNTPTGTEQKPVPAEETIAAPANVKAEYTGLSQGFDDRGGVTLTWDSVSGATGYRIYSDINDPQDTAWTKQLYDLPLGKTYTFYVTAVKGSKESAKSKATVTLPAKSASDTPTGGDNGGTSDPADPSGGGGTSQIDPAGTTKTMTSYLGVTRTATKIDDDGYVFWRSTDGEEMSNKNILKWDRTVDGTFTDGGKTWLQTGGVTFNKALLDTPSRMTSPAVEMYNGDPSKLTFEIKNSVEAVNTYTKVQKPIVRRYVMQDGMRLARVGDESVTAKGLLTTKSISFADCDISICDGTGFVKGNITVDVKYNSNLLTTWSLAMNTKANTDGLSPLRQKCWEIASAAIEDMKANGEYSSDYDAQMGYISLYVRKTYKYEEQVSDDLYLNCNGGRLILETYSIKAHGIYGFSSYGMYTETVENIEELPESELALHGAFHLNTNPKKYYETQGHYESEVTP